MRTKGFDILMFVLTDMFLSVAAVLTSASFKLFIFYDKPNRSSMDPKYTSRQDQRPQLRLWEPGNKVGGGEVK